ncbi:DUF4297 family anti-phage-associated protein [Undibacterium sp.]|uniref:DUF4297 family anti-phage-associated protein n=1 Tax=Undibacterium sp. TaxID=1914977 RepID=UPI002730B092|nr:DUF4297 family anti-phage-associated protein [Undibacterium sp.]MDP1976029.1 hypothetical protein [Undibacterium sp.]
MSNRAANATIKGYFYQFDHTIVQILKSTAPNAVVTVEGIEDVDFVTEDESVLIQCKYYEGTEYNHSVIKEAVIHMVRHFKENDCFKDQRFRYCIYGHFNGGQEKLPSDFNIEFLKKHFLTYASKNVTHEIHIELSIGDAELEDFRKRLEIDVSAKSYDEQQNEVKSLLALQIPGCLREDAEAFYYPNAITVIQSLAIQQNVSDRKITKEVFVSKVNCKEIVFNVWLRKKFGDEYYARTVKRKYFYFPSSTKIPKSMRIFVLDAALEFDLSNLTQLLIKIGNRFSHVENMRTPQTDRFCPYVLLLGISSAEIILLKGNLLARGVELSDGHAFHGAPFSVDRLMRPPTKDNLTKLKFIGNCTQLNQIATSTIGSTVEIFDFYKVSALPEAFIPIGISHNKIKTESVYFVNGVI